MITSRPYRNTRTDAATSPVFTLPSGAKSRHHTGARTASLSHDRNECWSDVALRQGKSGVTNTVIGNHKVMVS